MVRVEDVEDGEGGGREGWRMLRVEDVVGGGWGGWEGGGC